MKGPKPLTAAELQRHPLPEVSSGDKDSHGAILIIAGSREVPGASLLTATAAMRSGAGKLQLAVPEEIAIPVAIAMPEAMVIGHKSGRDGGFSPGGLRTILDQAGQADTIVAGPGLARSDSAAKLAKDLCALGKPLALDAAMLHELPAQAKDARAAAIPPILLPHAGEMASLLGCKPEDVEEDPLAAGTTCANRYGSIVLVKGVQSHIVTPDGQSWKYSGGAPGLGVSGSGDVLAGIVGGLLARGASPLTALLWAVWLHGEAGRTLSKSVGEVGFLAREIAGCVPRLLSKTAR